MVIKESRNKNRHTFKGPIFRSLSRPPISFSHPKDCPTPACQCSLVGPSVTRKTFENLFPSTAKLVITSYNWRKPVTTRHIYSTYASAIPHNSGHFDAESLHPHINYEGDTGETRKTSFKVEDNIALASTQDIQNSNNKDNLKSASSDGPVKLNFETIVSPGSLRSAWMTIKSNPGMLTSGVSDETLDKIDKEWFTETSDNLIKGTLTYPLRRRKLIPKPRKKEKRPLTIVTPRVKIIERAFLNHLEPIFEGTWSWQKIPESRYIELKKDPKFQNNNIKKNKNGLYIKNWIHKPIFLPSSHGFRPNKSCHSALESISYWRNNTVWLLDYDIRKAFDNVNRNRLENIFKTYIDCDRLWQEIAKMINAGIVDPSSSLFYNEEKGTAQGSILSPFLFNVYMTEFDRFIKHLSDTLPQPTLYTSEEAKLARKEYKGIIRDISSDRIATTLKKYGTVEGVKNNIIRRKKEYYRKWGRSEGALTSNKNFIHYVRYADDFVLGIRGSKGLALEIRDKIDFFLKSNLHLEVSHNKVVNRNEGPVKFLGFLIQLSKFRLKTRVKWNRFASIKKYKNRVINRLKISDARLANSAVQSIKKNLLRIFRLKLENKNRNLRDNDYEQISLEIARDLSLNTKENPALLRWENHFGHLFDYNRSLALYQYHRQITSLSLPEGDTEYHLELMKLRKKFISDIDDLIKKAKNSYVTERKDAIMKVQNKKKKPSISEETALKLAAVLTEIKLESKSATAITLNAPLKDITDKLVEKNFYHAKRLSPIGNNKLTNLSDPEIIAYYSSIMYGLLNFYSPASNFHGIKSLVEGLRRSCHLTLAMKHKKAYNWAIQLYGPDVEITIYGKTYKLPGARYTANLSKKFNVQGPTERFDIDAMKRRFTRRLNKGGLFFKQCAVAGCTNSDIEVHHIRKLSRKLTTDGQLTVVNLQGRRVTGKSALLSALNRKQLPLCKKHHLEFEKGNFSKLDTEFLKEIYVTKIPDNEKLYEVFSRGSMEI